jgi:hypothetical protein
VPGASEAAITIPPAYSTGCNVATTLHGGLSAPPELCTDAPSPAPPLKQTWAVGLPGKAAASTSTTADGVVVAEVVWVVELHSTASPTSMAVATGTSPTIHTVPPAASRFNVALALVVLGALPTTATRWVPGPAEATAAASSVATAWSSSGAESTV